MSNAVLTALFVVKVAYFAMYGFDTYGGKQVAEAMCVCFWVLYSTPVVYMAVSVPVPICLSYYGSE